MTATSSSSTAATAVAATWAMPIRMTKTAGDLAPWVGHWRTVGARPPPGSGRRLGGRHGDTQSDQAGTGLRLTTARVRSTRFPHAQLSDLSVVFDRYFNCRPESSRSAWRRRAGPLFSRRLRCPVPAARRLDDDDAVHGKWLPTPRAAFCCSPPSILAAASPPSLPTSLPLARRGSIVRPWQWRGWVSRLAQCHRGLGAAAAAAGRRTRCDKGSGGGWRRRRDQYVLFSPSSCATRCSSSLLTVRDVPRVLDRFYELMNVLSMKE